MSRKRRRKEVLPDPRIRRLAERERGQRDMPPLAPATSRVSSGLWVSARMSRAWEDEEDVPGACRTGGSHVRWSAEIMRGEDVRRKQGMVRTEPIGSVCDP